MDIPAVTYAELLGNPDFWKTTKFMDDLGAEHMVSLCPRCSAVIGNPHHHKAWHVQTNS